MNRKLLWLMLVGVAAVWTAVSFADPPLAERLKGVELKQLAQAPGYSEGPTWLAGNVYFCSGALLRVSPSGKVDKYLSIGPAGTISSGADRLTICDNKHKALLELTLEGDLLVLAESCDGQPLNSLNDLTRDARGNVYWTDPAGSSAAKPVGNVFRLTPAGAVLKIGTGLAFPNGLDVDPASEHLYVIESQSKKILKYKLPHDDQLLGEASVFYGLGGSGGDGCAFDAEGNLWVADFHRLETKQGRITVLSPQGKLLGQLDVPAKVVSNIAFGGEQHNEIYCTTGDPPGVFHAKVGVRGFAGHGAKEMKVLRKLPIAEDEPASRVNPRRFGVPGGATGPRGWYVWEKYDPATGILETRNESRGEKYTARVVPWGSTYRRLAYGAHVDELLPGERVNLFFSADHAGPKGYLVHFQDEKCQMKGHGHYWRVEKLGPGERQFTARVMAGDKPLGDEIAAFQLDSDFQVLKAGQPSAAKLEPGDKIYMIWVYRDQDRVVHLIADDASLEGIKTAEQQAISERIAREGMGGWLEVTDGRTGQLLIFSTHWFQTGQLKPGQPLTLRASLDKDAASVIAKLVTRKNLGTYGSGVSEVALEFTDEAAARTAAAWKPPQIIRIVPGES